MSDFADLPVVPVERVMSFESAEQMIGVTVPVRVPNLRRAGLLTDKATGEPFLAYYPLDPKAIAPIRHAVQQIEWTSTMRASTGQRNISRTFGMAPRKAAIKRESCRPTWMAMHQPEVHDLLVSLADDLQKQLMGFAPEAFQRDAKTLEDVAEEWRLGEDSLWTSGIVNKASALPYHRDRLNYPTWSAMPVLRRGMAGGHLHLPEYDVTVECRDGWCVFFPGYEHLHGVTPMHQTAADGYRYSIVYYALKGMKDCFTYAMELGQARRARTEREEHAAAVLRGELPSRLKQRVEHDRKQDPR